MCGHFDYTLFLSQQQSLCSEYPHLIDVLGKHQGLAVSDKSAAATLKFGRYQVLKSLFSIYTEANHAQSASLLCCPYLIFPHNTNMHCTTYDSFIKVRAKYIWSSTMALLHINL